MCQSKTCPSCNLTKPVTAFSRNKSTADGLQHECKDCNQMRYYATLDQHKARYKLRQVEHRMLLRKLAADASKVLKSKHVTPKQKQLLEELTKSVNKQLLSVKTEQLPLF